MSNNGTNPLLEKLLATDFFEGHATKHAGLLECIEQLARLRKYGSEFVPTETSDAAETINMFIDKARELTNTAPDNNEFEQMAVMILPALRKAVEGQIAAWGNTREIEGIIGTDIDDLDSYINDVAAGADSGDQLTLEDARAFLRWYNSTNAETADAA